MRTAVLGVVGKDFGFYRCSLRYWRRHHENSSVVRSLMSSASAFEHRCVAFDCGGAMFPVGVAAPLGRSLCPADH